MCDAVDVAQRPEHVEEVAIDVEVTGDEGARHAELAGCPYDPAERIG